MANARELFSAGRLIARQKAPYFRAVLLGLAPRELPGLWPVGPGGMQVPGTMGVTERGVLMWNPEFVETLSAEEVAFVLLHEVMHIVLKHGVRSRTKAYDPYLGNLAGDFTINPALVDMGCTAPKGDEKKGAFPEDFGFARGLTQDEYYALLRDKFPPQGGGGQAGEEGDGNCDQKGNGQGAGQDGEGDGEGGGQDSDHQNPGGGKPQAGKGQGNGKGQPNPHCGHGHCGSGGGNPWGNEPEEADTSNRSQPELERMVRQVAEEVREYAEKSRGTVPAGLARWADQALEPPKIPWQTKLARLARNAVAWRDGAVQHRYDAPGKRQAGIGYGLGKPVMPRLRQPVPEVSAIIDTSGSMGTQELVDALSEVQGVMKAIGAPLALTVCDAAVHGLRKVRTIQEAAAMMKGGGGTDMRPAFDELMQSRPRPEIIICVTDGQVGDGFPQHAPPGVKVICVLVGPYKCKPAEWCECVEVEHEAPKKGAAA